MTKYKIKNTNIMHNGEFYAVGSEIELPDDVAEKLVDVLKKVAETKTTKTTNKNAKTKTESETEKNDTQKTDEQNGEQA